MHRLLVGAVVPLGSNVGSPLFVFSMPGVLRLEPLSISIIIRLGLKGRLRFECISYCDQEVISFTENHVYDITSKIT